jgi:hypothetical protein
MAVEQLGSDRLGEEVRAVVTGLNLGNLNLIILDGLTYVMVADVDVLGAVMLDGITLDSSVSDTDRGAPDTVRSLPLIISSYPTEQWYSRHVIPLH